MKVEGWIRWATEGNLKGEWIASSSKGEVDMYQDDYTNLGKITIPLPDPPQVTGEVTKEE